MIASIAMPSYAIAAIAFLFLTALLLTGGRSRLQGMAVTVASLLTALWAAALAWQAAVEASFSIYSHVLELLRSIGWCAFLWLLLKPGSASNIISIFKSRSAIIVVGITTLIALSVVASLLRPGFLYALVGLTGSPIARIALAVIGMLLVEQLFRTTPSRERWGIKFSCLGIGGLFAYDFYLYSDAMLFRQIDPEIWAARGIVNALAVPLIAISAARNPRWSLGISVSRQVVFHSTALFGSALYLLSMSAAGYYLRFFGGSWGTLMQVVLLCSTLILLATVLFSGTFRSWLRVFISKHFYSYDYDYREEWIRFTRTLSKQGPALGERTIQAVADLVESPGGVIYIARESGTCELTAQWNMAPPVAEVPLDSLFCQFLETKEWVADLNDANENPEKYDEAALPAWLKNNPTVWLVVPLILQGKLFGFMLLAQPRSPIKLNWEVLDLLKIAGSQAASYLAQQESANALMVARQFESFNRMSTFMVHDLKNLVFQLSLLLTNAEKHRHNPAFQKDMLETVDHSVQKMKLLLHKLARGITSELPDKLAIDQLLQQAVDIKATAEPRPTLEIIASGLTVFANWKRLERVIGHLLQNAIEATPRNGKVSIRLEKQDDAAIIVVEDNGHGMSDDFMRERLFKPFESTKAAGMGIGAFESREYIHELGGRLEVSSQEAAGTTFRVILPLLKEDEQAIDIAA